MKIEADLMLFFLFKNQGIDDFNLRNEKFALQLIRIFQQFLNASNRLIIQIQTKYSLFVFLAC